MKSSSSFYSKDTGGNVKKELKLKKMKVTKQKRHRRIVRFYTACFGFHQPFKVLCDGTFVYHLLENRIIPADKALADILSATVKLYTTRCVLAELKRLGKSYSEALDAAHNLIIARCEHEKCKSADTCIMEVIGRNNSEHFFVASQDTDLRKKLQEVPGVPLICGLRNALFLEPPSASQRQHVKTSEEARMHMTDSEHHALKKIVIKKFAGNEEAANSSDENDDLEDQAAGLLEKRSIVKKQIDIKDKPQFKRKRAKGPNPLSCKKKKKHENKNIHLSKKTEDGDSTMKRSRKRKRTRKQQKPTEAES
ncbi:hypothetical protein L6164_016918 [Bauhinia variegata]|uniref:Uncharacterized protein n=1 Tax=Bauhinia variegata TaxID=167791 RepID=A0ACB9N852_BAUVA|nr:hypothetical protein L6164_016918 [Bauhinia variegata]